MVDIWGCDCSQVYNRVCYVACAHGELVRVRNQVMHYILCCGSGLLAGEICANCFGILMLQL